MLIREQIAELARKHQRPGTIHTPFPSVSLPYPHTLSLPVFPSVSIFSVHYAKNN